MIKTGAWEDMKTIIKIMILNDIRQNMKLLKNYGFIFVVLILIILFLKEWVLTATTFVRANDRYIDYAVSGIMIILFLFKRSPMIKINPASIYYLMDTTFLKWIVRIKQVITMTCFMILAAGITLWGKDYFQMIYCLRISLLMIAWEMLFWRKYQRNASTALLAGLCIVINAAFAFSWIYLEITMTVAIIVFSVIKPVVINWELYYKDMKFENKVRSASARKDYAEMTILANENRVRKSYHVKYFNLPYVNPVLIRSFIVDGLRGLLSIWIIKMLTLVLSLCSFSMPLNETLKFGLFIVSWSYLVVFINKCSIEAMFTLNAKREKGLFLPYTLKEIALFYTMLPTVEIVISIAMLIVFTDVSPWLIVIDLVVYCFITYLWHLMSLKFPKQRKWLDGAASLIIVAISLLILHQ